MDSARFEFDYSDNKEFYFGLFSDVHLDAKDHNRKAFEHDIESVIAKNGRVFFNGDIFDAIMPTDRKRYARAKDKFDDDAQVNALVEYGYKRLEPYADYIDYLGFGNHEVSIVKYNNTDVLALLAMLLNQKRDKKQPPIKRSGYVGFIELVFRADGGRVRRYVIYRDHGKGGSSPVTHGIINFNRLFTTYQCDMAWLGHSHNSIIDDTYWSYSVGATGNIHRKQKIGVITAGYNDCFLPHEMKDNDYYTLNFPEEKFSAPTGIGGKMLRIRIVDGKIKAKVEGIE